MRNVVKQPDAPNNGRPLRRSSSIPSNLRDITTPVFPGPLPIVRRLKSTPGSHFRDAKIEKPLTADITRGIASATGDEVDANENIVDSCSSLGEDSWIFVDKPQPEVTKKGKDEAINSHKAGTTGKQLPEFDYMTTDFPDLQLPITASSSPTRSSQKVHPTAGAVTNWVPWLPSEGFCLYVTFMLLLLITCSLLVAYTLSLQAERRILKESFMKLQRQVEACGSRDLETITKEVAHEPVRRLALFMTVFFICLPFLIYRFMDDIPKLNGKLKSNGTEEEVPLSKRMAYLVDVIFSNAFAKPIALLLATMLLISFGGIALYSVSDDTLGDALWRAWTYVADSGNHADSVGMGSRVVSVCISLGGLLIFALMLGLISDAISEKVDSLRKGKSDVIENNHTLILGWSDKLGSLLKQLAIANESLGGGVIVVLAERDKEEMELEIVKMEFDFLGFSF